MHRPQRRERKLSDSDHRRQIAGLPRAVVEEDGTSSCSIVQTKFLVALAEDRLALTVTASIEKKKKTPYSESYY